MKSALLVNHQGSPNRSESLLGHAAPTFGEPLRLATWSLSDLSGRLVEISAGPDAAHLTAAFGLVLDAQLGGDRAAWVTLEHSTFFPPDAADGGVDLEALPVVRVRDARMAGRAADHLARSGGFGLIVIDLSGPPDHLRQGYGGPPKLHAKAAGGHYVRQEQYP